MHKKINHAKSKQLLKKTKIAFNFKALGEHALNAAMIGAASGLGAATIVGAKKALNALSRSRNYDQMLEAVPSLKKENPTKTRMAFNTLHRLTPTLAKDPLVASTFVRRTLDTDIGGGGMAVDPATARMLGSVEGPSVDPAALAAGTISGFLSRQRLTTSEDLEKEQRQEVEKVRGARLQAKLRSADTAAAQKHQEKMRALEHVRALEKDRKKIDYERGLRP